jgi:hypothetical protein
VSSTDPRARKAYLRLGYGAPAAELLGGPASPGQSESLLSISRSCGFASSALARAILAKLSCALAMARTAPLAA